MSPEKLTQEQVMQQAMAGVFAIGGQLSAANSNDPYQAALAMFAQRPGTPPAGMAAFSTVPDRSDFTTSPTGQVLYLNGVIADPASGNVLFPHNDPEAEGSAAWLREIQESWGEDQVAKWRKRLAGFGFEVAEEGGMAMDLVNGLRDYHMTRYLNYGKPLKLAPGGRRAGEPRIRDIIDKVALKEEVKAWGEVPFGESLGGNEADYFADRVIEVAERLARKNKDWSPEQAVAGAEMRVQKEFVKTPEVSGQLDDLEDEEMDTSLEESLYSAAQLAGL